ncbi:MAG: GMC family oxidoreductase [Parachlamydiaceae bacterium]|nr:GMC family oxidoreductase [Parachlamydiaceae bacterium]
MYIKLITLALAATTISLFGEHCSQTKPYRCKMSGNELEADIIVIGGGAAGCILMSELSENGRFSVLGIEGGLNLTNDPAIQQVGLPAFLLPGGPGRAQFFWPGWTQSLPMPGLNGRTSDWTTGMLLGGGSSINGLYYCRGSSAMYSSWEEISGSDNWSLDKILKTFNKLENYQGLTITSKGRGVGGAVNVLQTPTISEVTSQVLLPASQAAFPFLLTVVDYNDPNVANCIDPRAQWFIDPTGTKRVSSATAYLNSTVMTPEGQGVNGHKLFMLFDSVALKIIFDKHGRAKKVKYAKDGQVFVAKARKAVVLASGINSSKLLQLSGIGPSEALQNAGIKPVFINENVGKHLQNHPLIFITMLADPALSGVPSGASYAFTINNIYLPVVGGGANDPRMLQILFEYIPATEKTPPLLAIGFDLLNPVSEGSVTIQSDNSFQIAAADDGFYQNPIDLENMKSAVSVYIRALLEQLSILYPFPSPYFKPILSDPINLVILSGYNDEVVEQYVKNNSNLSLDIHHFVSHCKMAPLDAGGVVGGNTLVHGTKNVYVGDNSICSKMPDGNTTAPAMMIGLRTSEILKHELRSKKR